MIWSNLEEEEEYTLTFGCPHEIVSLKIAVGILDMCISEEYTSWQGYS